MSNTRRARPRRHSRFHDMFDEQIAAITGWCDGPEKLEECKKQTHDAVISMLGDRRSGGVSWKIVDVVDSALELLEKMRDGASEAHLEVYDHCAGLLREHGGILVIATAPGRP